MIHLRAVSIKPGAKKLSVFPFSLPLVRKFKEISFRSPVVFLVGENGSGKSTLLEAIAAGVGSIAVGGNDVPRDKTLNHAKKLGEQLKFVWTKKTGRGFFLRAEDFFNFAKRVNAMSAELEEMAEYEETLSGDALQWRGRGVGQPRLSESTRRRRRRSHGESLSISSRKVCSGGLFLDDPKRALAERQLAFLPDAERDGGQTRSSSYATTRRF